MFKSDKGTGAGIPQLLFGKLRFYCLVRILKAQQKALPYHIMHKFTFLKILRDNVVDCHCYYNISSNSIFLA